MDVILLERIEKLGQLGDVVQVKDGFARNHLLPQRKAVRATKDARERFETERTTLEKDNASRRENAAAEAGRMSGVKVVIVQQAGDSGQLYGAVRGRDIAAALTEAGFSVDRKQVVLRTVIKSLGIYSVDIWLHAEEKIAVLVNVARSEEEARLQDSGIIIGTSGASQMEEDQPEVESLFEKLPVEPDFESESVSVDVDEDGNQPVE
jgi:large subunit ribosomal protein L9